MDFSQLSDPQYKLLTSPSEFMLFGGSAGGGKSWGLCLDPLRHVQGPTASPNARCALFRKTYPQLTQAGGLLDTTRLIYTPLGATFNQTRSEWTFPSGGKVSLNTLQYDKDIEQYLGAQWDWVGIDEAAAFTLQNVMFFWSRCRSKSGIKPTLRMTANPDNSSFLFPMIHWWLNPETGYPNYEKSGVVRHFTTEEDKFVWSDTPVLDEAGTQISTSMTFIPARITDNQSLMASDPAYHRRLMALPTQERERFLDGNWLASSLTDTEWDRTLFMGIYCDLDSYPTPATRKCFNSFAIDASKGKSIKKGDYSSIACVTTTEDLKYVDCDMQRRAPSEIVEDLFLFTDQEHHRIRSGDLIGIEALQFQSLFIDLIMRYAVDHPDYALSKFLKAGNIIIPVEDSLNKMMRIRRLDPFIKQRQFRFLQNPGTTLLVNQLKNFDGIAAKGKHDDGPDSLEMACNMPTHLQTYFENLRKPK